MGFFMYYHGSTEPIEEKLTGYFSILRDSNIQDKIRKDTKN